jgi:hypothetical protein
VSEDERADADELLESLVRKSLVQFDRDGTAGRYRLLEMVRVFASERLAEAGEADRFGRAHGEWIAGMTGHSIEDWATATAVDRVALVAELDNWREAVNYALGVEDPELLLRLTVHNMGADFPETARWAEDALGCDGISALPGAHALHWSLAIAAAAALDGPAIERHVALFEQGCATPAEAIWVAPPRAVLGLFAGGDAAAIIEDARQTPGLTRLQLAYLAVFSALWTNLPPHRDPTAARLAVELSAETGLAQPAVPHAFLAVALRDEDPEEALAELRKAESLILPGVEPFAETTVVGFGAMLLLSLPDRIAAPQLLDRLDRLQPHWNTSAAALLTVCAVVLGRTDDSSAAALLAYLLAAPGGIVTMKLVAPELEATVRPGAPEQLAAALGLARSALTRLVDPLGDDTAPGG